MRLMKLTVASGKVADQRCLILGGQIYRHGFERDDRTPHLAKLKLFNKEAPQQKTFLSLVAEILLYAIQPNSVPALQLASVGSEERSVRPDSPSHQRGSRDSATKWRQLETGDWAPNC